jgi:uncharacterized protein YjiS (DUF1127 family)
MAQSCDAKGWPFAYARRWMAAARIDLPRWLMPIGRLWRGFESYRARLASLRALQRLSDRELRDMGIERRQLGAIVERLQQRSEAWRRYHPWRGHDL